jgi:hypothetical protein
MRARQFNKIDRYTTITETSGVFGGIQYDIKTIFYHSQERGAVPINTPNGMRVRVHTATTEEGQYVLNRIHDSLRVSALKVLES